MAKTVSEIIVDTLIEAGAKRCYGIVGDTINHFTDAVSHTDLQWVHVRHEEVGALAAGGEAYMTGELAVCAGTCGPGSLHFVNGIFESHRNGAPVVLIASQVARTEEGLGFPQEVDQKKIYEQCAVFCERITHPDQARRITAMAAQAALARHGVAVIVVNGDVLKAHADDALPWAVNRCHPEIRPNPAELEQLAERINAARRPAIYAGIGARAARDALLALADRIKAPIAHTSRAKEFIEADNPYNVGMCGILGNPAGMHVLDHCDLLLCLGSDFAYTQFYPHGTRIVQIDIDPTRIGRRTPVDLGLVGDVGATIRALLPHLDEHTDTRWLDDARARWQEDLDTYAARSESGEDLIHPQTVTHRLDQLADRFMKKLQCHFCQGC